MARSISGTLLTAQSASSRQAFIKMLFTSYDGVTTYDFSKNSTAYGNRLLLVDHVEEPYNDYAIVILRNHDRAVPDLQGYWTEIGYGDITATGNEYAGDGSNGGSESTPRLWVKHQQTVSAGGKLLTILELEGMWSKLRETLLRMGSAPYFAAKTTDDDFSAAKTPYDIIDYLLTNEIDPAMSLDALVEDDSIMDTLEPDFEVNTNRMFQYAGEVIYDLLKMTLSFLKPKSSLAWEVKYPQTSDAVDLTYSSDTAPKFYEYIERDSVVTPNRIYVFANAGADGLYTDIITGQADDAVSQAQYGIVPDIALAPEVDNQADADNRAEVILTRQDAEVMAGKLTISHDCQMELYDRPSIRETRGFTIVVGDIGSVLDSLVLAALGNHPRVVKVGGNIFAVSYDAGGCLIRTFEVSEDGLTITYKSGALVDASGSIPRILHISGDVYAVAYARPAEASNGYIKTVSIDSDGNISAVIATLEYEPGGAGIDPAFIHVSGTTYALAYQGPGDDGWLTTVQINNDGTVGAVLDTEEYDGDNGTYNEILHISGNIFAIAYRGLTHWRVKTYPIAADGTIGALVDTLDVALRGILYLQLWHVFGNVYALAHRDTVNAGMISTFDIDNAGNIGAVIDTGEYEATLSAGVQGMASLGDGAYALSYTGPDGDGWLKTISIANDGTVGAVIDFLEFDPGNGMYPHMIWHTGDIYVIGYHGVATALTIKTVDIKTSLSYPNDTQARVSAICHIYRPGSYRLEATIGDVSSTVEIAQREKVAVKVPSKDFSYAEGAEIIVPKKLASEVTAALIEESVVPTQFFYEKLWRRLTPWKEEEGETFGKEVTERWRSLTPWREEEGETFGQEFRETMAAGFREVEKLGKTISESVSSLFKGWFGQ